MTQTPKQPDVARRLIQVLETPDAARTPYLSREVGRTTRKWTYSGTGVLHLSENAPP